MEMSNRRIFRIVALALVGYYWLLAIVIGGDGPAAGRWAGGLSFLSNWNLTLNLVVALGAIKYEFDGQKRLDIPILGAAMGINIIVMLLYVERLDEFGGEAGEVRGPPLGVGERPGAEEHARRFHRHIEVAGADAADADIQHRVLRE